MKRVRKIVADDGDVKLTIRVEVLSRNGLVTSEVEKLTTKAVRGIVDSLQFVPYTDFGVENTAVGKP